MELLPFKYKIIWLLFVNKTSCTVKSMLAFHFSPEICCLMAWFLDRGDACQAYCFSGACVSNTQRSVAASVSPHVVMIDSM